MMKLNNKGLSMVEVIVSIVLVSIVLVFMMNLFLSVKRIQNESAIASEYQILVSNTIKAVSDDIIKYGVQKIEWANQGDHTILKMTFNEKRKTNPSENIIKYLKVTDTYIRYGYNESGTSEAGNEITVDENLTNMIRSIPEDTVLNYDNELIVLYTDATHYLFKIVIPILGSDSNYYDINIVGKVS